MKLPSLLINVMVFQLGWFACVLAGNTIAVGYLACALWIHYRFVSTQRREWLLVFAVTLLGVGLDSLLTQLGIFHFESRTLGLIPLWLICLWCLFATTLCHSMRWLHGRLILSSLLGGAAGASSYYAGYHLGVVDFPYPMLTSIVVLTLCWAVLLPILMIMAHKVVR